MKKKPDWKVWLQWQHRAPKNIHRSARETHRAILFAFVHRGLDVEAETEFGREKSFSRYPSLSPSLSFSLVNFHDFLSLCTCILERSQRYVPFRTFAANIAREREKLKVIRSFEYGGSWFIGLITATGRMGWLRQQPPTTIANGFHPSPRLTPSPHPSHADSSVFYKTALIARIKYAPLFSPRSSVIYFGFPRTLKVLGYPQSRKTPWDCTLARASERRNVYLLCDYIMGLNFRINHIHILIIKQQIIIIKTDRILENLAHYYFFKDLY